MTSEELLAYNKNRAIHQIGFAVTNLEEAMRKWTELYHIGPWKVSLLSYETIPDLVISKGAVTPHVCYRIATAMAGAMQIELMEANETTPIYSDYIVNKKEGIHHFKEKVDDEHMQERVDEYASLHMPVLYGGHFYNASFNYIDTTEHLGGVLVELGNFQPAVIPEIISR